MFCVLDIDDYVRVEPELFNLATKDAIKQQLEKQYADYIDEDFGSVIAVLDVSRVGDGILIPEDPAAYYDSSFKLLVFKPELQELVFGKISQITNFGAFLDLGSMEAMIHISQTMDDYVTFSKANSLLGRSSKRALKKGDLCLARIVAVSFRTTPPKLGLTMRQPGLGKIDWINDEKRKAKLLAEKAARAASGKTKKKK
ncbi:MAG: DNA-directed RNA polymerase [archaeon]|nr:MAG: DNA-directed RNA polymerase [archaeon]